MRDNRPSNTSAIGRRRNEVDHGLDLIGSVEREATRAVQASGSLVGVRDPVGEDDTLTVADLAATLEADPWKKTLIGSRVGDEIVEAVDQAEAIAQTDVGGRHARECVPPRG